MVHVRRSLSAEMIEAIDLRLRNEMLDVERVQASWTFWPNRGGCQSSLAIVPFGAESAGDGNVTDQTMDDDDIAAVISDLGYEPEQSLQFSNHCGTDKPGHRRLAKFAASLAAEYAGIADLGDLDPHGRRLLTASELAAWCDHPDFCLEK